MTETNRKPKTEILKIRKAIMNSLKSLGPQTAYNLQTDTHTSYNTVMNNLRKYEAIGIVESFVKAGKTYWQLTGKTRNANVDIRNPDQKSLRRFR